MAVEYKKINDNTLSTDAPYQDVFNHIKSVIVSAGGAIKKENEQSGTLEGAWRYGVNPWGLRVTVQFRTVEDSIIELHVKGGFKDSFDVTGKGTKKAREIINFILGRESVPENSTSSPPRLGEESVANRGKSKVLTGILALIVGGTGAHKFYLGSWGIGLIYLISNLLLPGVAMVIGLVEAIRYFTLSDNGFDEKYNYAALQPFELKW